jgi:hypothetical protein
MRVFLGAAGAIALLAGAAPSLGQAGADFQIINDPTSLDWEFYGTGYKIKPIRDPAFPSGAAVEVDVQKGRDPYSAGTNIHLNQPIVTGRNYVVRFWARTLSTDSPNGKGRILVRFFRNEAPYPGFGDAAIDVGPNWGIYEVSGKATVDIPTDKAAVGMQLASNRQTIQFGQAIVAQGTTTLEGRTLKIVPPDPIPPQLAGKGELINDPENRNWVNYGKLLASAAPTATEVYTRKAVLLSVSAASEESADAGVNAPIRGAIAKGDNLIVAVLARSRSAATPDGQGWIRLRLQSNQAPYPGFGGQDIKLAPNWRLYQWHVQSEMDLPANHGEVAIHAGLAKQDVEIGPVYVLRGPAAP